jgi:hypothetical protein
VRILQRRRSDEAENRPEERPQAAPSARKDDGLTLDFEAISAEWIIARSTANECVGLACLQLRDLSEREGNALASDG